MTVVLRHCPPLGKLMKGATQFAGQFISKRLVQLIGLAA